MAMQYTDGTFSETMIFKKLMERFNQEIADGMGIKALHLGTPLEIEKAKEGQKIIERIQELEEKVKDLSPVNTTLIVPTKEEIRTMGRTWRNFPPLLQTVTR